MTDPASVDAFASSWTLAKEALGPGFLLVSAGFLWRSGAAWMKSREDHTILFEKHNSLAEACSKCTGRIDRIEATSSTLCQMASEHRPMNDRITRVEDEVRAAAIAIGRLATKDDLDRLETKLDARIQNQTSQLIALITAKRNDA